MNKNTFVYIAACAVVSSSCGVRAAVPSQQTTTSETTRSQSNIKQAFSRIWSAMKRNPGKTIALSAVTVAGIALVAMGMKSRMKKVSRGGKMSRQQALAVSRVVQFAYGLPPVIEMTASSVHGGTTVIPVPADLQGDR